MRLKPAAETPPDRLEPESREEVVSRVSASGAFVLSLLRPFPGSRLEIVSEGDSLCAGSYD